MENLIFVQCLQCLAQVRLTTNKTKLDIYYNKPAIRVASGAAKRLSKHNLRNLENNRESSNLGGLVTSLKGAQFEINVLKSRNEYVPLEIIFIECTEISSGKITN